MSVRKVFVLVIIGFVLLCGGLIVESGLSHAAHSAVRPAATAARQPAGRQGITLLQQTTEAPNPPAVENTPEAAPAPPQPQLQPAAGQQYSAVGGPTTQVTIGSVDKTSGFKYQLVLHTEGAGIQSATFSEFDTGTGRNREPLTFLAAVPIDGRAVRSMANGELTLLGQGQRLNLNRLSWQSRGVEKLPEGGESAAFEATIVDSSDQPVLKLTKTYRIHPNTYLLDCTLDVANLTHEKQQVQYALTGPAGLEREAVGTDMRKVIGGFRTPQGQITTVRLDLKALSKAATPDKRSLTTKNANDMFLWAAAVNRYFAAILVPVPPQGQPYADWIDGRWGTYYTSTGPGNGGSIGLMVQSRAIDLEPAGQVGSARSYPFNLYVGPKDKTYFDKDERYRQLGFVQTIDFGACCCPAAIINPLAFGILAIMKAMYFVIPNYGVVIIILVLVMRLVLHPITRHSQIAMNKMSKLAPRAEEIKKKYANNKAEMNKKLMELYREQGASPIMGFLPMMAQLPIWIALWSAIYTSIALRGAAFLPFWITDLSAPDALVSFPMVTIPFLGWTIHSLNLLPILMGVAFYLQQKIMPMQQPSAATNPQVAQQQKIMNIMMPLLFPLMLYNAPSGVNLYIMASTFAGVIEQYVIKKHIQQKEEEEAKGVISATSKTGGKVKKKKPKPFYRF